MNVEPGDLVLTCHYRDDEREPWSVSVVRADPVIWADGGLINLIRAGGDPSRRFVTITGDYLTVEACDRTLIYRVGVYDPVRRCYLCSWPD